MINSKDFFIALDLLEKEKNINKDFFISALESALTSAYKKNFGEGKSASVKLNPEKNTIKVLAYKTIVDEVQDFDKEISLADAKKLKSTYKVGDIVSEEVTPKSFGRIAIQTARQVVMQKLREAERISVKTQVSDKVGQLISAEVKSIDPKNVYVELAGFDAGATLSMSDLIPGETFQVGDHTKVCIKKIRENNFGTQIQVSRTIPAFVTRLFELEIPEVENGEIEIKSIAREAGSRTKIAVESKTPDVDPVGICVGNRGSRINNILNELHGEKIDIIPWSEDACQFIASSLSPSNVLSVEIDEISKTSKVIVPDNQLSLAIGKDGQNVKLAVKLTGWKIDVKSESQITQEEEKTKQTFENFDQEAGLDLFEDLENIE